MSEKETKKAQNEALMQRMAAAFAQKDLASIGACFCEDGVFETSEGAHPWGERFTGRQNIQQSAAAVFALLPDIRFEEATHWATSTCGAAEWTCRFTTPKGRAVEVQGCDMFQFKNGLVQRKSSFFKRVLPPKVR